MSFWGLAVDRPKAPSKAVAFVQVSEIPGIQRVAGEAGGELVLPCKVRTLMAKGKIVSADYNCRRKMKNLVGRKKSQSGAKLST